MEIVILIFSIIFILLGVIGLAIICRQSKSKIQDLTPIFITTLIAGVFLLTMFIFLQDPSAMDVYRNKTELQITYKVQGLDTLQRDTTVVFK